MKGYHLGNQDSRKLRICLTMLKRQNPISKGEKFTIPIKETNTFSVFRTLI